MKPPKIEYVNLNEYLNDADNLAEDTPEWWQRLKEAVKDYNQEFKIGINYITAIRKYRKWKINKFFKNELNLKLNGKQ